MTTGLVPFPAFEEFRGPEWDGLANVRACVFLDRDGVLNRRRLTLVRRWQHFRFVPGVEHALARLARLPVRLVVVTNQDWVGAGYIGETEMAHLHREMVAAVRAVGGRIDAVYACIHPAWQACTCRKPLPGMLTAAAERYGLDPRESWIVGDNAKDMVAGRAFGCRTILVDPRLRTRLQGAEKHADRVFSATPVALEALATEVEKALVSTA